MAATSARRAVIGNTIGESTPAVATVPRPAPGAPRHPGRFCSSPPG